MQLPAIGVGGSGDFDVEVCRCLRSLAHVQICRCFCLLVQIQFLMVFANRWFATGAVPLLSGLSSVQNRHTKRCSFAPGNMLIRRHRDASLGAEHVPPIMLVYIQTLCNWSVKQRVKCANVIRDFCRAELPSWRLGWFKTGR